MFQNLVKKLFHENKFLLIAGPCAMESQQISELVASELKKIITDENFVFVFKTSFDKANRTSINSYRGLGMKKGLDILNEIKHKYNVPIVTDVHCVEQVEEIATVADIIQIPAFLCRQTDLIVESAKTEKIINIKKGQFMSPESMIYTVEKANSVGNENILVTERGSSFGYNNLVVDMRSLLIMKKLGLKVIFDATHSVQLPTANFGQTGGDKSFVPYLAKAAMHFKINGLFFEVHPNPQAAKSDKTNMLSIDEFYKLYKSIKNLHYHLKGAENEE